jgi:hypothetical protein
VYRESQDSEVYMKRLLIYKSFGRNVTNYKLQIDRMKRRIETEQGITK